jgi:hypothetical protein
MKVNPWEQAKQNALYVLSKFNDITHKDIVKKIAVYVLNNPVHEGDVFIDYKLVYNNNYFVWEHIHNKQKPDYPACTICLKPNICPTIGGCKHGKYMGICVFCRKRGIITLNEHGQCETCETIFNSFGVDTLRYIALDDICLDWFQDTGMDLFNQNIPGWLKKKLLLKK